MDNAERGASEPPLVGQTEQQKRERQAATARAKPGVVRSTRRRSPSERVEHREPSALWRRLMTPFTAAPASDRASCCVIACSVTPSSTASGASTRRCGITSGATALTSSGATNPAPRMPASMRAARNSASTPRVDNPRLTCACWREAAARSTMYALTLRRDMHAFDRGLRGAPVRRARSFRLVLGCMRVSVAVLREDLPARAAAPGTRDRCAA